MIVLLGSAGSSHTPTRGSLNLQTLTTHFQTHIRVVVSHIDPYQEYISCQDTRSPWGVHTHAVARAHTHTQSFLLQASEKEMIEKMWLKKTPGAKKETNWMCVLHSCVCVGVCVCVCVCERVCFCLTVASLWPSQALMDVCEYLRCLSESPWQNTERHQTS